MRVSALLTLVIGVFFLSVGAGGTAAAALDGRVGQPADIAPERIPVPRRPQGGAECAGELAGADAIRESTAEQARGHKCAGDQAGLVRVALGGDPPGPSLGVDLDRQCPTSARARGSGHYHAGQPGNGQLLVEQPRRGQEVDQADRIHQ